MNWSYRLVDCMCGIIQSLTANLLVVHHYCGTSKGGSRFQDSGFRACSPHNCVCGKLVDARDLHGLSCRRSTPRHQCHAMLNDIIWRSIKRAQIPTHKEPTGLVSQEGKRPDGVTMIPWASGKPLAWDVTVPDTYAESHIISTSAIKTTKYLDITSTHIFYPISIETAGSWDVQAVELMEEMGRHTTAATNDQNGTMYLFQRISMAIQRGNDLSHIQ